MANRSPRHLHPGQHNLRGKREKSVCPCCAPIIDHRQDVLLERYRREIAMAPEPDEPEDLAHG